MRRYSLSHVSDRDLLRDLASLVAQDRATTATLLAHVAEVDERKLYLPAAYPSMFAYCLHELRLSEDSAYKRIRAARTARQFPVIFEAVAEGRLNLSAVVLMTPYLTAQNVDELLQSATHKTKSEIEELIAARFPRSEMLALLEAIPDDAVLPDMPLAAANAGVIAPETVRELTCQLAPGPVESAPPRSRVAPVAHERFLLQLTIGQSTRDKLRHAQELLSHEIPSGDVAEVLDRALGVLIDKLEKRKFAATTHPQEKRRSTSGKRTIPADVRRTVWERDGGRCTFVSEAGRRCPARAMLEYDHIEPVARGGEATTENIRLRCRAHNDYAAECEFGAEFMNDKRHEARRAAAAKARARAAAEAERSRAAATEEAKERAAAAEESAALDVTPWLRRLGFRADEARQAATHCQRIPDAPLEERVRAAIRFLRPGYRSPGPATLGRGTCAAVP